MLQNRFHLLSCDTREPLKKVVNRRAVFDIVKQGMYGNTSAFEDPCSADFPWLTFHFRTVVPVTIHARMLPAFHLFSIQFLGQLFSLATRIRKRSFRLRAGMP